MLDIFVNNVLNHGTTVRRCFVEVYDLEYETAAKVRIVKFKAVIKCIVGKAKRRQRRSV